MSELFPTISEAVDFECNRIIECYNQGILDRDSFEKAILYIYQKAADIDSY